MTLRKSDDRAAKDLCDLIVAAIRAEPNGTTELDGFVQSEACTSSLVCRARVQATRRSFDNPFGDVTARMLSDILQIRLTAEHVAAQERMTAAADRLQRAALSVARSSYWMAAASFVVAAAALYVTVVKG